MHEKRSRISKFRQAIQDAGFMSVWDVLALPDPVWLLPQLFTTASLIVLWGVSAAGKTFVALDLLNRIVSGTPWNGSKPLRGIGVYIYGEGGAGIKKRLRAWMMYHERKASHLHLMFENRPVNLTNREDVLQFIDRLQAITKETGRQIRIVVFDTLSRCMPGADENSQAVMSVVVQHLDLIREAIGCAVMVLHHTGLENAGRERGSSVLRGAADTSLGLKRKKGDGDEVPLTLTVAKQKDGEDGIEYPLTRLVVDTGKGVTSCVVRWEGAAAPVSSANDNLTQKQQTFFDIIDDAGDQGISWDEVRNKAKAKGIGTNRSSTPKEIRDALEKKGVITETDGRLRTA